MNSNCYQLNCFQPANLMYYAVTFYLNKLLFLYVLHICVTFKRLPPTGYNYNRQLSN